MKTTTWRRTLEIAGALLVLLGLLWFAPWPVKAAAPRQPLIVLDGLRPDYVTPAIMPTLHALGERGVVFSNHHSVFPTVTRVNASSFSTGTYPEIHGLLGNSVFFPQVDPARFLGTDDRATLERINGAVQGHLLTAPTLGEILQRAGRKLLVVSAGSSGSALLLNHTVAVGAILHTDFVRPDSMQAKVSAALGEMSGRSSEVKNRRAVDLFLKVGLREVEPAVTIMWFTDPDTTAHERGIGTAETTAALKTLDRELKRLFDGMAQSGVLDQFDIWVTSDHGFSTHTGGPDLQSLGPLAGTLTDGTPRLISGGGALYVRDHDRQIIDRLVRTLQQTPGVGAIFTPPPSRGSLDGRVAGTLSFDAIRWQHERSADILFSPDWTDRENPFGYRGTVTTGGVAGHGSSSPYDVHNTLIAAGPDLKRRAVITTPSGNVDFAPTLLRMLGLDVPVGMQGRTLEEAFLTGPDPAKMTVRSMRHEVKSVDSGYTLEGTFTILDTQRGSYRYFDQTRVMRTAK